MIIKKNEILTLKEKKMKEGKKKYGSIEKIWLLNMYSI